MSLDIVYEKLIHGDISCSDAAKAIKDEKSKILFLTSKTFSSDIIPYSAEDIQFLYMVAQITQYIYNNSDEETGLSDYEYDLLYEILMDAGDSDGNTSAPVKSGKIAFHKYTSLRGTLKKIFYLTNDEIRKNPSRKYLDEWKSSMESKIFTQTGQHIDLDNEEIYVFPKFDGISGIFEIKDGNIDRVLTRGYTETNEAQDISFIFSNYPQRKYNELGVSEYGLKTEVMVMEDDLDYYNTKYGTNYKNTRSIASAITNSDDYDPEKISLLHVVPLRVGDADGHQEIAKEAFENYPYLRCRLKDREAIRKFANEHRYVNDGLRCDGAVIHIINPQIQEILGRENDINNFEVAYKFTEDAALTKIIGVDMQVGLFGRLAPVAKIEPVKLKGNTISSISLGSFGRFTELGLCEGDTVKILYDIIPYLAFDEDCHHNGGKAFKIPNKCPICKEEVQFSESMDIATCVNPNCPCRIKGRILNYLNKMNIENISYGVVNKLYEYGYLKSIEDLYEIKIKAPAIVMIDGFGPKTVNTWIESIDSKRTVYDYIVLGSLGIEGMSKKTFKKICDEYTIDEILDIVENKSVSRLIKVRGIKDKSAIKIIDGLSGSLKLLEFLSKELDIIQSKGNDDKASFSVCFTKIRDTELEKLIESLGGEVNDSLTKDTTFLVVPNANIKSSKVDKANKYGTKVVPIMEFEDTLREYLKSVE